MAYKSLPLFRVSDLHFQSMKAASLLFIIILIVGCGAPVHDSTFIANRSGVLFYGDSIFGKWDLDSAFPGQNVINGGHFGKRTDELLAALPDALSGKNVCSGYDGNPGDPSTATLTCHPITPPATIVILAGWNNMFQGYQVDARPDIKEMVKLSRAAGVAVVLCTVYPFDPAHPASWMVPDGSQPVTFYDMWRNPMNDSIAQDGVTVVDMSAVFAGQSGYTSDGVHPNSSGYAQMHDAISPALR
jgi:lysophospholipase L1-like esterase